MIQIKSNNNNKKKQNNNNYNNNNLRKRRQRRIFGWRIRLEEQAACNLLWISVLLSSWKFWFSGESGSSTWKRKRLHGLFGSLCISVIYFEILMSAVRHNDLISSLLRIRVLFNFVDLICLEECLAGLI